MGTFPGIQYGDDYQLHYTNRSLIDKGYADGKYIPKGTPAIGDILYFDGSNWVSLPAPTSPGQVLTATAGLLPSWQ